jgi:predicted nucleotide-binding protein
MDRILLADNDPEEIETWSAVLMKGGYEVITALSVSAAQEILFKGDLDLAVIDLHMVNNDEDEDLSGLLLAKTFRETVPVVLFTGRPTADSTIEALRKDGRSAPAVAVIRKHKDGPEGLLKAVREAIVPKVFVSHGHDLASRNAVVKFLSDGGARAIVFQDQPVNSRTILDAFEEYANVQFTIILMTPDDEGRKKGEEIWQARARQNVIFELGFFLAKLGPRKVVILSNEGQPIEWPSNFHGILYREMDPGDGWQLKLARDMSAAGIKLKLF